VTVQEVPGKQGAAPTHDIIIQGDVAKHAGEYLQEHYQVPKKFIEVTEGKKKKGGNKK